MNLAGITTFCAKIVASEALGLEAHCLSTANWARASFALFRITRFNRIDAIVAVRTMPQTNTFVAL